MRDVPLIATMICLAAMGVALVTGAVYAHRMRAELVRLCTETGGAPRPDGLCDMGAVAPTVVHLSQECQP